MLMPEFVYSATTNHKSIRPFLNGFGFSIDMNERISSPVVTLLLSGGPSAIFRRIVAVIVDPVYRVLGRWARPHIREKCVKAALPSVTNFDTSQEIKFASGVVRVIAAPPNIQPSKIFGRVRLAVGDASGLCNVFSQAAARSDAPSSEVFAGNCFGISAFTGALPVSDAVSAWRSTNDRKAVVCIANFVLKCRHNILRKMLSRVCGSGNRHGKRVSVASLATLQLYHVKAA